MRLFICIVLWSLCSVGHLKAQSQALIDSLTIIMEEEIDPFQKSNYAYQIGFSYMNTDPEKGLAYTKLALRLLPSDSLLQVAQGYNLLGITYAQLYPDSLAISIDYFEKALTLFTQEGEPSRIGDSHINISNAYVLLEDYDKALDHLYKAKELYESIQQYQSVASVYNVLTSINTNQGDYKQGLYNAKQNINFLFKQNNEDSLLLQKQPNLLANAQYNVGLSYLKLGQLDSAESYLIPVLASFQKIEYSNYIIRTASSLADLYLFRGDLSNAERYLLIALEQEAAFQTIREKLNTQNTLANLYHKQQKYDESIALHEKILATTREQGYLDFEVLMLKSLSESYAKKGNTSKAYELLVTAIPLNDSIVNKDRDQAIEDLEIKYATRYESEKKERENKLLTQELDIQTLRALNREQLMYGTLGVLLLVVIIFVLVIRQNRIESNRRMQQLNYRLLLNQMSPHFIFNALTAIQSFVYKNDPRKAGKYLSSFAKLMRAILENSRVEYIPLSKELQWLDNYLRLQALRFNNKFEYEVIVDEALEVDEVLLPPMLTQPFIENAIEHGIKDLESKGLLTIQFKLEGEQLAVSIEDNGVGFDVIQPKKSNHISLATKITKERLGFLNQGHQNKIDFNISSVPNMGTAVSFSIPVQYS